MSVRRNRLLLRAASVAMVLASLLTAAWAVRPPAMPTPDVPRAASRARSQQPAIASPPVTDFAKLWQRPLRRPLYDPPPAPPPAPRRRDNEERRSRRQQRQMALDVQLIGTMLEGDNGATAVFLSKSSGEIDLKQVGDTLRLGPDELRIERIESRRVTLTDGGRSTTLAMLAEEGS